jgi:integrase
MVDMAKFPYMARRSGSKNLYYKRPVPKHLQTHGRPKQIWRSLGSPDPKAAKAVYRSVDAEIELQFQAWEAEDGHGHPAAGKGSLNKEISPAEDKLTQAMLRRLADAHYLSAYQADFDWRGGLWHQVEADEALFWDGAIIEHPKNDWVKVNGSKRSFYAYLMESPDLETVFLYAVFVARKKRLDALRLDYKLGKTTSQEAAVDTLLKQHGITLGESDRRTLLRKLLATVISALEDISAGDETSFDFIISTPEAQTTPRATATLPQAPLLSQMIEKYIADVGHEKQWPRKTVISKRGHLNEFLQIAGNRPVNSYSKSDGVAFKDVQLGLPLARNSPPFSGMTLSRAAEAASELRKEGKEVERLTGVTINEKLGSVGLFFAWAASRDETVINPVIGLKVSLRNRKKQKNRHPWTTDELNKMFAAPIYTGCLSEHSWMKPGNIVLRQSAKFWVPLIGLFTGMRLGEIIQLRTNDIRKVENIQYFDVTPCDPDPSDAEAGNTTDNQKSLKTAASQRSIPVHKTLLDIGFDEFVQFCRVKEDTRLFPEYTQSQDDGSWSKQYSKHFKRFRESIGVTRRGVKFHSLRHNMEDALRNSNIAVDIRNAIQGHSESGVSREYGSGFYVRTLNDAIQKVSYPGLKINHLIKTITD